MAHFIVERRQFGVRNRQQFVVFTGLPVIFSTPIGRQRDQRQIGSDRAQPPAHQRITVVRRGVPG